MPCGFFLNDSGFRFTEQNIESPSRSRWRVRTTTIAPTIVLKDGSVQMVIGAPGAGRIPTEIVQVMIYVLDYRLDPLEAACMPRIFATAANREVQVEHGFTPELLRDARAMGYDPVTESSGYARLYLVVRQGGSMDRRRRPAPRRPAPWLQRRPTGTLNSATELFSYTSSFAEYILRR